MSTPQRRSVKSAGCLLLVATTLACWLPGQAFAAAYTWNSTSGGNWSNTTATGWNTGGAYPNAVGDSATFNQPFAASKTFTIDAGDAIVGSLALNNTSGNVQLILNRTSTNTLTFDAVGSGPATLGWSGSQNIDGSDHEIRTPVVLNDDLVASGGQALRITGDITGTGKKITINNSQFGFLGNNTNLTGGITINAGSQVHFYSLNALGGGGSNVYVAAGANGVLGYNPGSDANLASAVAKIDPTSAGMFGWGIGVNESTLNYNINLSGVPSLRFGVGYGKIGVTAGSLIFDFANNGNKYAIGGAVIGGGLFDVNGANYFTGNRNLDVAPQALTLWKAQDYSGNTTIGGTSGQGANLLLAGNGTALNSPSFTVGSLGTLTFDNNTAGPARAGSPAAANLANRIGDTVPITLNGGTVYLVGSGSGNSSETVGTITVNTRESQIKVDRNGGNNATLTGQSLARGDWKGVGTVAGNGTLGTTTFIKFNTTPTQYGGGGGAGSTTMSLIPWLYKSDRTSFVTYDSANGLRPLDTTTEYANSLPIGSVTTQNVRLTAGTTMADNTTINSLVFTVAGGATLGFTSGKTLTLSSGGMIVNSSGTNMTVGTSGSTLDLNGREGVFVSTADKCYINAKITNTGGNGVTIGYGGGTYGVIFGNGANDYTGPTTVAAGQLMEDAFPGEVIPDASELRIHSGASFLAYSNGRRETVAGLSGAGTVKLTETFKFALGSPATDAGTANGVNLQGGFISPGDDNANPNRTPGTLILQAGGEAPTSNNLRIASGTINLDLASLASNDMIRVVNGNATITGGSLVISYLGDWHPLDASIGSAWKIIDLLDGAKTLTGSFASASITAPQWYTFDTMAVDNDLYLRLLGVPEPATGVLLALAALVALRRRR